jgi:hypothetical protein
MDQEKDDIVIFDSSLTTDQLRQMWGNGDEEGFVEYTKEEIDQLAEDINDAIHNVIEDFLNHRS